MIIICVNYLEELTMSYRIEAWIAEGSPRIRIIDAATGDTRVDWSGHARSGLGEAEFAALFRRLLLLSCEQAIGNVRIFSALNTHQPDESAGATSLIS